MFMFRKRVHMWPAIGLISLALIFFLSGQAEGQCVTIPLLTPITTSELKGRVQDQDAGAIPRATIELWKQNGEEPRGTLLREVIADEEGSFSIPNVKEGKYLLIVRSRYFAYLWQTLRLKATKSNKGKQLVVLLALDGIDPCSEAILR